MATAAPGHVAIVLAGGRGTRLGGADKGALVVGGRSLLAGALAACHGAESVVVVGAHALPDGTPPGVLQTREEPAHGGPAAAVVAGLVALEQFGDREAAVAGVAADAADAGSIGAPFVLLLACDLAAPEAAVAALLAGVDSHPSAERAPEGWCLLDPAGRPQWLVGLYRADALGRAARALGNPTGAALGALLRPLEVRGIPAGGGVVGDVDSPEDLARLRR